MAEFERVNAGVAAAKARGVRLDRPATLTGRSKEVLRLKSQGLGIRAIARNLKMAPSSVHKVATMATRSVQKGGRILGAPDRQGSNPAPLPRGQVRTH